MRITHYTKNYVFAFFSVFALLLINYTIQGQTTLISPTGDGGFENGSTFAANGWSESSGANNPWVIGTAVSTAPIAGNSAYISNDGGTTNAYTPANNATNFFWRDVTVPPGETKITLSFNWSQQAENSWDIWQVFYAPTSVNPIGSTTHPGSGTSNVPAAISGATYIGNGAVATGVQTATYNLPASLAGTTFRLIFSWKNETGGVQPPAAIDNISLVSDVPGDFISAMTGDWNVGATWMGGVTPSSLDNATITAGHVVTINASSLAITNLTIDGTLAYGATPAFFAVNGNLTVNSGGVFNVFQSTTGKTLSVAGNITNNGTIDISVGATIAGNLTLNGSAVQTISGAGSFNTNVIRNLTCSNTNTSTPNIIWNVNNIKIAYNLNLTGARIETNGNKITFGNNAAGNTLTAPIGTGFLPGAKFSRWWTTTVTGTAITAGTDPTNTTSRYPFINSSGQNRAAYISRTGSTTGNVAGELAVVYNDAITITTGLTIADGAYTITDRYNGNWVVSTEATSYSHAGAHTVVLLGQNAYFPSNGNSRVMNAAGVVGTHQNGTTTPGAQRTGLTTAQLTAGALYMGINEADIPFLSVASGDWNDPTKWNKGTIPVCTDNVTILNGHTITVNSAANVSRNVTINAGGTLVVASGDLTVGCTLNNNTLTNNGTLTVQGGTLNVNGRLLLNNGGTINQTNGDINVDGNDAGIAANSVAASTAIVDFNVSTLSSVNLTGGTLTIVDPHANTTASLSLRLNGSVNGPVNVTNGHTIRFGNGISTDPGGNSANGFRVDTWATTTGMPFGQVIVNGPSGTNRFVTSTYQQPILGSVTVNNGGEFRMATAYINENLTVNAGGTFTSTSLLVMTNSTFVDGSSVSFSTSTNHQIISGSGTFRNLAASPTANLTSLTVNNNNATGVTLNVPLSVSGTLTLTSGFVNTTSTNILQLGTAIAAGTLVGGSATAYVNGPFARTFPASRTAAGTYTVATLYPVGKTASSAYLPIHVDPTTNSGGPVIISSEAFTTNSGTGATGVMGLSSNRWEALITSGVANFTSTNLRLNDAAIVSSNKILQASSAAGTYGSIVPVSTFAAGTPNTLTTTSTQILAAAYNGYFAYGNLEDCVAPADQPTAFVESNLGTTTMTGSFTAATSNPSHYLVVRYLAGDSPTHPSDFTSYTVGQALGLGTVRSVSGSTTFNDTGLTANTQYDYYVYSYNNVGCNGPVYNITSPLIGNIKTCDAVTGTPGTPTASLITSSSFTATWTVSSTPGVNYIIEVATDAGFTSLISGYNPLNVGMLLSTPVTGLAANTTYYVRVRAELAGCFSVNSGTLTITTELVVAPPYLEGFNTLITPTGWNITGWTIGSTRGVTGNPGNNIYKNLWSSAPTGTFTIVNIGPIVSGMLLTFDYKNSNYSSPYAAPGTGTGNFVVSISTDFGQNYTTLATIENSNTNAWQSFTEDLSSYSGQNVKLRIVATRTSGDYDLAFDNIKIDFPPACPDPSGPSVGNLTNTAATASWTAASPEPVGGYQYYLSTSNIAPDGNTTPTGSVGAGITMANLTGLSANTTYYFWVRSNCTFNQSSWIAAAPFTTLNVAYVVYLDPAPKSINDVLDIYFEDYDVINNFYTDGQATIWMYGGVRVGGNPFQYVQGDINNTSTLVAFAQQSPGLYKATVKLADYFCIPSGTVVEGLDILFRNQFGIGGNNQTNDLFLDLTDEAIQVNPPTALMSSNVMATTADISWTAPTTGVNKGYEYATSTTNTPPGSGTPSNNTTENLSGLTPSTTYYFWVRTKGCGSDVSDWSIVGTFDTPCLPPTITGTTPATRCGTGTVTLGATASAGDINWYANQNGGSPLGTGTSYVTPSISTTTTYWAGAVTPGGTENAGRSTYAGTDNTTGSGWGLVFTVVNEPITINSVDIYSVGSGGNITVELRDNAGTLIQTVGPFAYPSGTTGNPVTVTLPLNLPVPVGTGYRLLASSMGGNLIREFSGITSPYTSNSGNVSVTNGYISGNSTTYYWFYNWVVSSGCAGPRTAVVATVDSPPALTLSAMDGTICSGANSSIVTITSAIGDFDSYNWDPATGVSGNQNDGYTFTGNANTTFTLTAAQTGGSMCQNTADFSLIVNPLPLISGATVDPNNYCPGGNSQLEVVAASTAKDYVFAATSGSFTPLVGGVDVNAIEADDVISDAIPIGFPFKFGGNTYSNAYASSNGFLSFNLFAASAATNNLTSPSSALLPLLAPLWDDLDGKATGGSQASYLTEGTTPNRVFTMEWLNWEWNWQSTSAVISFQVKLYEFDNRIEFVYRQEAGAVNSGTASIGIASAVGNYISLNNTSASPTASSTSETSNLNTKPATGQIYTFTPPSYTYAWSPATFLSATNISNPTANAVTTTTAYTAQVTDQNNCSNTMIVSVNVEGTVVKNSGNAGFNTLRGVYDCITEGGTITYDQPTTDESILTATLDITKSVVIQGLNAMNRPEITIPSAGMNISATKTLTLDNVDVKYTGSGTFTGSGTVEIIGTTVGKE